MIKYDWYKSLNVKEKMPFGDSICESSIVLLRTRFQNVRVLNKFTSTVYARNAPNVKSRLYCYKLGYKPHYMKLYCVIIIKTEWIEKMVSVCMKVVTYRLMSG
jgi:hypothetical protein